MASYNKISELVSIKTFAPVINLQWANDKEESLNLLNGYIITEEIAEHFESILESITLRRSPERLKSRGQDIDPVQIKRSFIIRGQYGTGKSYFLVVLSSLMESVYNGNYDELMDKFKGFPNITYHLKVLKETGGKLYTVRINGEEEINKDFDDLVQESIINSFVEQFGEHYFESSYEKALATLNEYKKGDLWPIIEKSLEALDLDFEGLESGLMNKKSIYLNKYKELIQRALSQDINIHKDNIGNFIEEASKYVKTKGFSGLLLVVDELSAYLKSSQEDKRINKDLAHLQTLAESSSYQRNNDLFFIISMHVDLKNFLDNIMTNEDDINKVTGRFEALNLNFESGNELIKNLIVIDESKLDALKQSMPREFMKLQNINGPAYKDYYPMHPLSLSYLKDITENFAQKERTIFQFIAREIKGRMLKQNVVDQEGNLNLIKIDSIFDFFRQEIGQKRSDIVPSINESLKLCESDLEEKVVKALITAKLTVYGNVSSSKSRLSLEEISELMLMDESKVKLILDKFTDNYRSNIVFDENDSKYEFVHIGTSKINLDELIKKEIDKLNPDIILKKLIRNTSGSQIRREYSVSPRRDVTPVERTIKGQEFSITHLKGLKSKGILSLGHDGTINFIIPNFTEDLNSINDQDIKNILGDVSDNVCIAVPSTFNINENSVIRIEALDRILGNEEVQKDENIRKKVEHEIVRLRRDIQRSLKRFSSFDNFKFIFKEGVISCNTENDLHKHMIERYYTKFPKINAERISGRASTNRLIDNIISKGESIIPEGSTKEEDRQIVETLVPLGMANVKDHVGGKRVKITKPSAQDDKNSKEIWDLVISGEYNTRELTEMLTAAPFGLKDFIIEVYLSCALYHESIRIVSSSVYLQNNSKQLSNIGKEKAKIVKVEGATSIEELQKVKILWETLTKIIKNRSQNQFDPEVKVNTVSLRTDLSQYLSGVVSILESKDRLFKMNNIEIKEIGILNELIEKVRRNIHPDHFIEEFIEIPNAIYGSEFSTSIYDLEELLKGIDKLDSEMDKIDRINKNMKTLDRNKYMLKDMNGIEEALEEVDSSYTEFFKSPLEIDNLDVIEKKQLAIIKIYNDKFNLEHKKFWNNIKTMQDDVKSSKHLDLLSILEQFNFENIRSKEDALKNLTKFSICNRTFENSDDKSLSFCNCIDPSTTVKTLGMKYKELEGLLEETYKILDGIISNYVDGLKELNFKDKNGVKLVDYLNQKEDGLHAKYIEIYNELLNEFSDFKEDYKNDLQALIVHINDFLKEEKPPVVVKRIDYGEFNDMISKKVIETGKSALDLEAFIGIVRQAWKDNEEKYEEIKL